jgi:hypothetical protein
VLMVHRGYPHTKPPASRCYDAPLSDSLWGLVAACSRMEPRMRPTMPDVIRSLSTPDFAA